jgi:hypothetical protein
MGKLTVRSRSGTIIFALMFAVPEIAYINTGSKTALEINLVRKFTAFEGMLLNLRITFRKIPFNKFILSPQIDLILIF